MSLTPYSLTRLAQSHTSCLVKAEGDCLKVTNGEGLSSYIYAGHQQVVFEMVLFPADRIHNKGALDHLILRTHQLLPLNTMCVRPKGGNDCYMAFGAIPLEGNECSMGQVETLLASMSEIFELYRRYLACEPLVCCA